MRVEDLRPIALFNGLTDEQLAELAGVGTEVRIEPGVELFRAGEHADYWWVLVEGAIARMTDLGMLDDEAFARTWVESRDRARPRGERAIREELRTKGIDRETIDIVLGERRDRALASSVATGGDGDDVQHVSADRTAAERLLAKNARTLARVADPRQRRQRAYGLLARHGFDPETCREVTASVLAVPED